MALLGREVYADVNPPSIGAVAAADIDIAVAGLRLDYLVDVYPPVSLEAGLSVQGANVVDSGGGVLVIRLRLTNASAGAIDGASRRWGFGLRQEGD